MKHLFKSVHFFAGTQVLSLCVILTMGGCCWAPEYITLESTDKDFFIPDRSSVTFNDGSGSRRILIASNFLCDYSNYRRRNGNDDRCINERKEMCGQSFAESLDQPGPLDFSMSMDHDEHLMVVFRNDFIKIENDLSVYEDSSVVIGGIEYDLLYRFETSPRWQRSDVAKLSYSRIYGPVEIVMTNGQTWYRVEN